MFLVCVCVYAHILLKSNDDLPSEIDANTYKYAFHEKTSWHSHLVFLLIEYENKYVLLLHYTSKHYREHRKKIKLVLTKPLHF